MRSRVLTICIFAGALTVNAALTARAQSNGAIQGRVEDDSGAVVAGANVTVRSRATNVELVSETDSEGNYQFVALPVGLYRIEVRAPGFQTEVVQDLVVEV